LEIAVESIAAAKTAERAGADRIELCADLSAGGLTPSAEVMREARNYLHIPIFAMIRSRPGDFVYSDADFALMQSQILQARELKMDGVVFGLHTALRAVDIERSKALVDLARPMQATFHRAFDVTNNLPGSLDDVIATGATRVLSSGAAPSALEGAEQLRVLVQSAGSRIIVMPGAGIHAANFAAVRRETKASEFHSGLGSVLPYGSNDYSRFESEIRQIIAQKVQ
jgi:copper homeostasis protein